MHYGTRLAMPHAADKNYYVILFEGCAMCLSTINTAGRAAPSMRVITDPWAGTTLSGRWRSTAGAKTCWHIVSVITKCRQPLGARTPAAGDCYCSRRLRHTRAASTVVGCTTAGDQLRTDGYDLPGSTSQGCRDFVMKGCLGVMTTR